MCTYKHTHTIDICKTKQNEARMLSEEFTIITHLWSFCHSPWLGRKDIMELEVKQQQKNHQFEILFTFQPREDIQTLNFSEKKEKSCPF